MYVLRASNNKLGNATSLCIYLSIKVRVCNCSNKNIHN